MDLEVAPLGRRGQLGQLRFGGLDALAGGRGLVRLLLALGGGLGGLGFVSLGGVLGGGAAGKEEEE